MTKRKKAYIGTGIGKKRCDTSCVIDEKGHVLEREQYYNTTVRATSMTFTEPSDRVII